jgi:transcriptional pleiotropic regulator of transition state genes
MRAIFEEFGADADGNENTQTVKNDMKKENLMKSTGIIRRVDELGRVVLPIELRRTFDIAEKDALEIYVADDTIVLKKYAPACIFCNNAKDVTVFKGKNVCQACLADLRQ